MGESISIKSRISGRILTKPLTEVTFLGRDIIVKHRWAGRSAPSMKRGGKRGEVTKLSKASHDRLLMTARSLEGQVKVFATLNYGGDSFPTNGRLLQKHWAAMRKWLTRRGVGGLMVKEFQARHAPHIHLLLNERVNWQEMLEAWRAIVSADLDASAVSVRLSRSRKQETVSSYIAKRIQKEAPEGFTGLGRFWSVFGKIEVIQRRIVGARSELAPLVRMIRRYEQHICWQSAHFRRGLRNLFGYVAWGISQPILAALPRLL